jgi:hypothetical protein
MAQLAVLWSAEPAAAVTHTTLQDAAVDALDHIDAPAPTYLQPLAIEIAPDYPAQTETAKPTRPDSGIALQARILAASRLLANPPPFGV